MSKPIIEVRNLSKRYHLGAIGATSLREEFSRYWDRLRGVPHPDKQDFWALRDVSFDVHPGEVVGVIGRNGAGKSTLLKILSRITEPTSGNAILRGRVASLLEVGTGFHPELTGRENVFLNGAILGMTRAEVRRKFDEIVAFAEVEQFIDTPVKRYSSGMYVRLAFAVAAHLEPEILIVDEVLAVGDVQFQQKCLGKIQDVARGSGRTVLFVSHQTDAVRLICSRCLWLADGEVKRDGPAEDVITAYLNNGIVRNFAKVTGAEGTRLLDATIDTSIPGQLAIELAFEARTLLNSPKVGFVIRSADRRPVLGSNTQMQPPVRAPRPSRRHRVRALIPLVPLHGDRYHLSIYIGDRDQHLLTIEDAVQFQWTPPTQIRNRPPLKDIGPVLTAVIWEFPPYEQSRS